MDIIKSSKYNDIFNIWKNAKKVKISKEKPKKYLLCASQVKD